MAKKIVIDHFLTYGKKNCHRPFFNLWQKKLKNKIYGVSIIIYIFRIIMENTQVDSTNTLFSSEFDEQKMAKIATIMQKTGLNPKQSADLIQFLETPKSQPVEKKEWTRDFVTEKLRENNDDVKKIWYSRIESALKFLNDHPEKLSEPYKVFGFLNITLDNFKTSCVKVDSADDIKTRTKKASLREMYFNQISPLIDEFTTEVNRKTFEYGDNKYTVRFVNVTNPETYKNRSTSMADLHVTLAN